MCGRYAERREATAIAEAFTVARISQAAGEWEPSWNIKPTSQIPVVVESAAGEDEVVRRLELARWSLVPPWAKELASRYPTFNARSESAAEKRTFAPSVKSRRALIPAVGYYEWTGEKGSKIPHWIYPATDGADNGGGGFAFAGLYSWWADKTVPEDREDRWHLTATILTAPAVEHLAPIHDRQPVILPGHWWDRWLNPEEAGDHELVTEAVHDSNDVMATLDHHEVAPLRGDGPGLIDPV